MTPQRSFVRKIQYLVAMAVLLMVLVWLGQPATIGVGTEKGSAGGVLAQLRQKYQFSEAQLGEIDPASETIKLATLGLRGVAVQVLWEQSNTYKMKKDWANLASTLQKIIHLEPHFSKVWYFQGWNLSYNVSVEFDDYRERYRWVIKGIDFLKQGIRYNRNDALLYKDVGWFISQKIGRADESKQFRELFKEDEDFHREDDFGPARPPDDRDNWRVGKDWYARAEDLVDPYNPAKAIKKVTPVVFFAYKPMCQMNFAEAQAKDGIFSERGHAAWKEAGEDWTKFGNLPLPAMKPGVYVHLNDREQLQEDARKLLDRLEAMQPGLREQIRKERLADPELLTREERRAYELPQDKRTPADWEPIGSAERKLHVRHEDVAFRIAEKDPPKGKEALDIAKEALDKEIRLAEVASQQSIVNFTHWKDRARVEQTPEALAAREAIHAAEEETEAQNLARAEKKYREAFEKWRLVLDKKEWPDLKKQDFLGEELVQFIRAYRTLLENESPPRRLPKDFILQDVFDLHDKKTPIRD